MQTILEQLKEKDEKLWNAYQKSYDLALKEWLPHVAVNKDSTNSLPHLLGVMDRINTLLYSGKYCEIELSGAELYVLACAVLMHDLGKLSMLKPPKAKKDKEQFFENWKKYFEECQKASGKIEHAQFSAHIIKTYWHYLGIYSERIARIISLVCCFHECNSTNGLKGCPLHNDYYLEEFGHIRARLLGALLIIGDHLDDTFHRVVPEYFAQFKEIENIAKFRGLIQDTRIDKKNKMICSVIDTDCITTDSFFGQVSKDSLKHTKRNKKLYYSSNVGIFEKKKKNNADSNNSVNVLFDYLLKKKNFSQKSEKSQESEKSTKEEVKKKVQCSPLSSLIGHVWDNANEMTSINNELYILNMPIKKWFIECDGHLFEVEYCVQKNVAEFRSIKYALEPSIDKNFLDTVFTAMLKLSTGVFGKRVFTYFDLLNYIHAYEDDFDKIKTAVRRIGKTIELFNSFCEKTDDDYKIYKNISVYCNDNIWQIEVKKGDGESSTIINSTNITVSSLLSNINKENNEENNKGKKVNDNGR